MSRFDVGKQLRLNVISKNSPDLRISIIVGSALTISHLKRKIQTEFNELHGIEVVVKVIEDSKGFIISNNSNVDQHFSTGDTIYFSEHQERDKKSNFNMNLSSNIGEILSTMRFMTGSALQKLDKINLTSTNSLEIATDLLHIGFWFTNQGIVKRLFHIYNKIFNEETVEKFITQASQNHINLLIRNFTLWIIQIPNSIINQSQIIWELMQLFEKFTMNIKFVQLIKLNKLTKNVLELSKDQLITPELKKIAGRIIKNINGGRGRNQHGTGISKTKSSYIPSMLGASNFSGIDIDEVLGLLKSGSQDQKISGLDLISESNFEIITQATVRSDYYEKLMNIFTLRKFKNRKHITVFNQVLVHLMNNSSKEKYIEIMQKDILNKLHQFLLQGPIELHQKTIQFTGQICKASVSSGMFNLEVALGLIDSPYPEFQKYIIESICMMSGKLTSTSSIRFIPGIKSFIKTSLKTNNQDISYQLLRILGNLTLDEQCRYQIINLKGIQVFVKFLETSSNDQICRACSKGLLNLAISTRQNKAKVLSSMNGILEIFYQGKYDSVTYGFIETILKSKNI